jgi:menaquinone-9 beta-reductase
MTEPEHDVIIVGGGLAGLTASILLGRAGARVLLIEKKQYPFHKVCGEYVSNEILVFLRAAGFDPIARGAAVITRLRLSTPSGKAFSTGLEMGGFGLSRFVLDEALLRLAAASGVALLQAKVYDISRQQDVFRVQVGNGAVHTANFVIGSYGKRTLLDRTLDRGFMAERKGFLAVKYHIRTDAPRDEIALHAFHGGYCGLVKIEEDKYNLCYLYKRNGSFTSVKRLEEDVLVRNPQLERIFARAAFLSAKPDVISGFSFAPKRMVENDVFMLGDSAGLIAPLCGNGMAMAIHSAKLLCDVLVGARLIGRRQVEQADRDWLAAVYENAWRRNFALRMRLGRALQPLFLNPLLSELSLRAIHAVPVLRRRVVEGTHGKVIRP